MLAIGTSRYAQKKGSFLLSVDLDGLGRYIQPNFIHEESSSICSANSINLDSLNRLRALIYCLFGMEVDMGADPSVTDRPHALYKNQQ